MRLQKTVSLSLILLVFGWRPLCAGEAPPKVPERTGGLANVMEEPVTVDFTRADLSWVLNTLFMISGVNIVTDEGIGDFEVTAHVEHTPLKDLLSAICAQNNLRWEIVGDIVRVFVPPEERVRLQRIEEQAKLGKQQLQSSVKIHMKLASGDEVGLEGSAINDFPFLMELLSERIVDQAKDGLVVFHLSAQQAPEYLDEVKALLSRIAPKVALEYNEKLEVLIATGDDTAQLHRVAAVMRALSPDSPKKSGAARERPKM